MDGKRCGFICLAILGVLILAFGLLFGLLVPAALDEGIKKYSRLCDTDGSAYKAWQTNTQSDAAAKYKYYYGFNITNAQAYLSQASVGAVNLTIDSRGPYALRQYDTKFNITFSADKSTVNYSTWETYEFDSSKSCSGCGPTDLGTNFNPTFLGLLTRTNMELVIALSLSNFDATYMVKIAGGYPTCTTTTIGVALSGTPCDPNTNSNCCCNIAASNVDGCFVRAQSGFYSKLAQFDGGVQVGSFYSPLIITKTIHEAGFGYPSALAGFVAAQTYAQDTNATTRPVSVASLAALGQYTALVRAACSTAGSNGIAGSLSTMATLAGQIGVSADIMKQFAHISCAPLSAVSYWAETSELNPLVSRCQLVASNGGIYADACVCAHNTSATSTTSAPCCTKLGFGCLAPIPGYVSSRLYTSKDAYHTVNKEWAVAGTGCGSYSVKGSEFWNTHYNSKTSFAVWNSNGVTEGVHLTPAQVNTFSTAASPYVYTVKGSGGSNSVGVGRTSAVTSNDLTDGKPYLESIYVFISQALRPQTLYNSGTEKFQGVTVNRFIVKENFLDKNVNADPSDPAVDNFQVGVGHPFSGVVDTSYIRGFPSYLSRPYFLYQTSLLSRGMTVTENGAAITPTKEKHDTYLLIEPALGATLSGHKRLQAAFSVYPCTTALATVGMCASGGSLANVFTRNVPGGIIVPTFFMDETASATTSSTDSIQAINTVLYAADIILIVCSIVGFFIFVLGLVLALRKGSEVSSSK
eukprot:c21661_g7_i1.p1 GENE.c21661_g7_i1~~c21661_g7_i1.p1  ORF type:complete len:750 (-),score=212.58 c21661_g7_i1:360-2609(-)